jgi:hypothetical protein
LWVPLWIALSDVLTIRDAATGEEVLVAHPGSVKQGAVRI